MLPHQPLSTVVSLIIQYLIINPIINTKTYILKHTIWHDCTCFSAAYWYGGWNTYFTYLDNLLSPVLPTSRAEITEACNIPPFIGINPVNPPFINNCICIFPATQTCSIVCSGLRLCWWSSVLIGSLCRTSRAWWGTSTVHVILHSGTKAATVGN